MQLRKHQPMAIEYIFKISSFCKEQKKTGDSSSSIEWLGIGRRESTNVPEGWLYTVSIHRQCVYFLYQVTITCKIETKNVNNRREDNRQKSTGIYMHSPPPPPDKQSLPDRCDGWSIGLVISWWWQIAMIKRKKK